jgi:hypothetical protein
MRITIDRGLRLSRTSTRPHRPALQPAAVTIWRHARKPEAEHVRLDLVIDRDGLLALRSLIDQAVAG